MSQDKDKDKSREWQIQELKLRLQKISQEMSQVKVLPPKRNKPNRGLVLQIPTQPKPGPKLTLIRGGEDDQ